MTKEEILNAYLTDEHPSPVIQYLMMTTHRDVPETATPTSERIQKYLDTTEKHNSIIKQYI